jgi:hypothetical protein
MVKKDFGKIIEIAEENKVSIRDVLEIYKDFDSKVYSRDIEKNGSFYLINPILEEEKMKLTERYFRIYKERK